MATIKIKRGLKQDLPILQRGELGYATDTNELFIGVLAEPTLVSDNVLINDLDDFYTKSDFESLDGTGIDWDTQAEEFKIDFADETEALDNTNETKVMNPKRTDEAITARLDARLTADAYATETQLENAINALPGDGLSLVEGVLSVDEEFDPSGTYANLRAQATTATDVGLSNVTNESKATMFTSPTFTGTVTGVTKNMVGLGNVDNVQQIPLTQKSAANGVASLDANSKVPLNQLPDTAKQQTYVVATFANLPTTNVLSGDKGYVTGTGDSYIWNGSSWLTLAEADWENVNLDYGNITNPPTIGNGSLSLGTSGIATGSQTFTANQTGNATFTVNVPGTNIAQGTRTTTTVPVTSSTGTNATLSAATTSLAGVMTSADKTKLDGIADGAQVNVGTNLGTAVVSTNSRSITSSTGSNVTVPNATTTVAGFMSHTDKSKLDGIAAGAQVNVGTNLGITAGSTAGPIVTSSTGTNATLPIATATASGVITTGNQTFAGTKTFNSTITGSISGNAGTATTLANTRSINGTNFNGSANITTANWGTARTLTVGSTGKSVNGSGNVSWSLAEIGAASSSHGHGDITSAGAINSTVAIASGDHLVIADNSQSNRLETSTITFGTGTSTYLRNDGVWGTPPQGLANVDYYTLTIASGDWSGTDPVTVAKTVSGVLSSDRPLIDLDLSSVTFADVETKQAEYAKLYRVSATANNQITFYALEAPTESLDILIKVVR